MPESPPEAVPLSSGSRSTSPTAQRFVRLEELFQQVVDLDSASRAERLARLCPESSSLRESVERLVDLDRMTGFGTFAGAGVASSQDPLASPDAVIGSYKVIGQIGTGGMGIVLEAEQSAPLRRRVAIKLVRRGLASDSIVERFEAECQTLAVLDHPYVARVFEAGSSEDGRPYFVMELVKGVPISRFCDARELSTRQRLELFLRVCDGVQHAHQKAILHRDLKPTNVLVVETEDGPSPKIIDFGIARTLDEGAELGRTRVGQVIGTPAYMSPEQASGSGSVALDVRSDLGFKGSSQRCLGEQSVQTHRRLRQGF